MAYVNTLLKSLQSTISIESALIDFHDLDEFHVP